MNYIVKNNITPLCFLPSGDLICYQYGKLIIIRDEKIITKYEIIRSKKERYIGRINLFFRLFRLGVRVAETIDDKRVLLNVGNHIYEYDFLTKKLSEGYYIGKGIRPLILTNVKI